MSPDQRIARLASRQFGLFSREQALAAGFTVDQIEYRVSSGRWVRVHRGVYRIAGTPDVSGSHFAALLAIGPQASLSHCTAGTRWGLVAPGHCEIIHVSVKDRSQPRLTGVEVHRPRVLRNQDIARRDLVRLTKPGRTLLDLSSHLDDVDLENAADQAVRLRLVNPRVLLRRVEEEYPNGRKGRSRLMEYLRERAYPNASGSAAEARFLRLLRAARLPLPDREVKVSDERGEFIGRVDFAYRAERVAIEIDGYAYHGAREPWERDHQVRMRLIDSGWLPLAFTARGLNDRPDEAIASVRRALRRRALGVRGR